MRSINYKYALALNLSIIEDDESTIYHAIDQARNISRELDIQIRLLNSFNKKEMLIDEYSNIDEIYNYIK